MTHYHLTLRLEKEDVEILRKLRDDTSLKFSVTSDSSYSEKELDFFRNFLIQTIRATETKQ